MESVLDPVTYWIEPVEVSRTPPLLSLVTWRGGEDWRGVGELERRGLERPLGPLQALEGGEERTGEASRAERSPPLLVDSWKGGVLLSFLDSKKLQRHKGVDSFWRSPEQEWTP